MLQQVDDADQHHGQSCHRGQVEWIGALLGFFFEQKCFQVFVGQCFEVLVAQFVVGFLFWALGLAGACFHGETIALATRAHSSSARWVARCRELATEFRSP